MKNKILNALTSSKNERKVFSAIWSLTNNGKGSKIIKDADFKRFGLPHRNRRNEAVLRLIKKGLISRVIEDGYWYECEGTICRYSIKNWGCVRFLWLIKHPCFQCKKMVNI